MMYIHYFKQDAQPAVSLIFQALTSRILQEFGTKKQQAPIFKPRAVQWSTVEMADHVLYRSF